MDKKNKTKKIITFILLSVMSLLVALNTTVASASEPLSNCRPYIQIVFVFNNTEPPEVFTALREDISTALAENSSLVNSTGSLSDLDGKIKVIEKEKLPETIKDTFKDREYTTVETLEEVTLYRVYGGTAKLEGGYATTLHSISKSVLVDRLALLPAWGNSVDWICTIKVPSGTKLNIGLASEQRDKEKTYSGGASQVLLPRGWNPAWVSGSEQVVDDVPH